MGGEGVGGEGVGGKGVGGEGVGGEGVSSKDSWAQCLPFPNETLANVKNSKLGHQDLSMCEV